MRKSNTLVQGKCALAAALLLILASAAIMASPLSEFVYDEDFRSPADSGWPIYCEAAPGEYCFPVSEGAGLDWEWIPSEIEQAHFTVETGARDFVSDAVEYGLLWGSPGKRCYFALVNPNEKTYRIGLIKSDLSVVALEEGDSRFINSGTQWNKLRVEVSGDEVALLINGVKVHQLEIRNRGNVSFALAANPLASETTDVRYNYLRIESLEAPAIIPETIADVKASCGIDMMVLEGRSEYNYYNSNPGAGYFEINAACVSVNVGTSTAPKGSFKFRLIVRWGGGVHVLEEPQNIPWPPGEEIWVGYPSVQLEACPFGVEGITGTFEIIPLRGTCDEDLSNNEGQVFQEYGEEHGC